MADDDLRRRLEKLVALRDHPSTLPAIRDSAARAYQRLSDKDPEALNPHEKRSMDSLRDRDPMWDNICEVLNVQTRKIWKGIRPGRPNAR